MSAELFPYSRADKAACAEREVRQRQKVYERLVAEKKMSRERAEREIGLMLSIAADYAIPDDKSVPGPARALIVSKQIQPMLYGLGAELQSAVLADLMSLWLAGHIDKSGASETAKLRKFLLEQWVQAVLELVPASQAEIMAKLKPEGSA